MVGMVIDQTPYIFTEIEIGGYTKKLADIAHLLTRSFSISILSEDSAITVDRWTEIAQSD